MLHCSSSECGNVEHFSQCGENLVGLSVLGDGNAQGTRNDPDSRLASPKRTENLSGLVLGCTKAKF